ncbi:hypothetical protein BDV93DRAFT_576276 [Ceratobasidium sp. AG-I]|nr:hypothetical protein BDV93DRAFT_576276 [Ceratobasidium sp. AG-I]
MYTKFTKCLVIQGKPGCKIKHAASLISYAKHTALLPQLRHLSVRSLEYSEDQFDWVAALFCNSLLQINVIPNLDAPPPLSLSTATLWLDEMSTKCPNLHVLSLYPYSEWREWDDDMPGAVRQIKTNFHDEIHVPITKLTQLHRLSVNMYLTGKETFTAIARLPNLECLKIGITYREDTMILPPAPVEGFFPKLQHLSLHHLNLEDMITALSTEYLLRGLASLDLMVDPRPFFEEAAIWEWEWSTWGTLGQNLRQATWLKICFGDDDDILSRITISQNDFEHLANIPLRHIFMRNALLNKYSMEEPSCALLARTWPNITHLHMLDQPAEMEDLIYFSSLPHLCHLTLDLTIRSVNDLTQSPQASGPEGFRILKCSKARCGEEFEPAQVGDIAR